jgi:cytochrome c5
MTQGEAVYRRACASCHDRGVDGAQVIGDRDGWRARIVKGMVQLTSHSIEGFSGAVGHMPPRGDNPSLSDAEVAAAVCYLVEMSR